MPEIEAILNRRTDLSTFVVHLTRADRERTPLDQLASIYEAHRIEARAPQGWAKAEDVTDDPRRQSQRVVVCFSEVPLEHIHLLTGSITLWGVERRVPLAPYGVALTKLTATWLYRPRGGYYERPGAIELRAYGIGRCSRAYLHLKARVASRPGGRSAVGSSGEINGVSAAGLSDRRLTRADSDGSHTRESWTTDYDRDLTLRLRFGGDALSRRPFTRGPVIDGLVVRPLRHAAREKLEVHVEAS